MYGETDNILPSPHAEGYGQGRPGSAAPTDNKSIDKDCLAGMVQRFPRTVGAAETPYLMDDLSPRSATPPAGPPTQGQGSGFGSTANGGNRGNEDLKSSDDVDDADIEGHVISSDPEPDAGDWDFDVHDPPSTSTARDPDPVRIGGDIEATGTVTLTFVTEAALKEFEETGDLKIDIDWALMNDEFDAWMEGDSSDEDGEEGGGKGNLAPAASGSTASKNVEMSEDEWTDEANSIIR